MNEKMNEYLNVPLQAHRKSKVALSFVVLSHDYVKLVILNTFDMVECKITYLLIFFFLR